MMDSMIDMLKFVKLQHKLQHKDDVRRSKKNERRR